MPGKTAGGTVPPRLAGFYAAYFLTMGVMLPFWPAWLADRGLGASEVAAAGAAGLVARALGAPLAVWWADRRGRRRRAMILGSASAFAVAAAFVPAEGFASILVLNALFGVAVAAVLPLGEALTMSHVAAGNATYGGVRLWGSIAFVAASVGTGFLVDRLGPPAILAPVLGGLALMAVACAALPPSADAEPAAGSGATRADLAGLLRPRFLLFILAAGLVTASHGLYYALGTPHWRGLGISDRAIGALWAVGVVAEVVLFGLGSRLLRRMRPATLLALAGLLAAARWLATAWLGSAGPLVFVQTLHAFSFGAAHLAAMHHLRASTPPALAATAQSVYGVATVGLMLGLALLASGPLYGAFGGGAYAVMALLAFAGGSVALGLRRRRAFRRSSRSGRLRQNSP